MSACSTFSALYTSPRRSRFCSASGVRSTITVSLAISGTQSGTVSRTVMPVIERTVGAMLSMCWIFSVDRTSILAAEDLLHVLVALAVLAAGNIRVRQFVHQDHLRTPGEDGVHVHLLENGALIFDLPARDRLELLGQFRDAFAAVRLHDADDHVFAAAAAADTLAQHRVGLAHARRVAEKELEGSAWSFRAG